MTSLIGVRTALQASGSGNAALLTSLMDAGKLAPYKSKEASKRKLGLTGADNLWYPSLGKKQAPAGLGKLSTKQIQEICLRDLPRTHDYYGERLVYFSQSGTSGEAGEMSAEDAGMQTINGLTDTNLAATETVVTFPSESLEDICSQGRAIPENLLRAAMTTCTVLPNGTLLPLQHSNEGTTITTLLSGSIAWIIWPPTDHNIRTLQTAYGNYAEDLDETKLDVANDLEGGMIFVQTEGDGLRIPPFCPMMSLALKTSVLATNSQVTVDNYISMLQKLPLLKAWYQIHQNEKDGNPMLSSFNASILLYLDLMLNGHSEHEDRNLLKLPATTKEGLPGTLLGRLLSVWDSVKDDLAAVMGSEDHKAMENIWETFLVAAKGRKCWICSKEIRNKQKGMKKHFVDVHWAKIKVTKRIDSMEALEEGQQGGGVAGQAEKPIVIDAEEEDVMDVDE